jgi:superfamily II DNA/RNA helicase
MVCDSTYLIDKQTNISLKLTELKHILLEKLDIKNKPAKILIFSEWVTMLNIIAKMLHSEGIGYAQLTGKVAVKNRSKLINKFETDENCKIFLSSEAGGTGLNLQVADTVINFELPWNPAKKNQRFGRIDRLGQRNKNLTIINIIAPVSIEGKIAAGLTLKQNLFDSVLNAGNGNDIVDFSTSGRSQFLLELEKMLTEFTTMHPEEVEIEDSTQQEENLATVLADEASEVVEVITQIEDKVLAPIAAEEQIVLMEKVMNQGLEFLSGLFKMATGNEAGLQGNKVEVDKTTGEVVMRFKMPVIQ